jgi:hypothetical protein
MRLALLLVFLAVFAPAAQAQEFADWTTLSDGNTVVSGTFLGAPVSVTGGQIHPSSPLDGSSVEFASADFSPPLPRSDAPELFGTTPATTYTMTFGRTVRDPILHLFSLGSVLTFPPGTQIVKRSGQPGFTVSQNVVQGGTPDVNGTIQLAGDFDRLVFSALWPGGQPDGIDFQVGGVPVPSPPVIEEPTPVPTATPPPAPPAPVSGVRVVTAVAAGEVFVKGANGAFVPLGPTAPVGSTVDARRGSVDVTADNAQARLAAGIFTIRQRAAQAPAFVLATPAGLARACAPGRRRPAKGVVRTLKVTAKKGLVRTVPKKGIVSGRDASWTTTDTCDGTVVSVQRGRVTYTIGRKALKLQQGRRYRFKAKLFGAR